jgi:hypothetical protein
LSSKNSVVYITLRLIIGCDAIIDSKGRCSLRSDQEAIYDFEDGNFVHAIQLDQHFVLASSP